MNYNDPSIGKYRVIAGRRVLLSERENKIRRLEEMAHDKADAHSKAYYVVEAPQIGIFITSDPSSSHTILRVCLPLS